MDVVSSVLEGKSTIQTVPSVKFKTTTCDGKGHLHIYDSTIDVKSFNKMMVKSMSKSFSGDMPAYSSRTKPTQYSECHSESMGVTRF